MEREGRGRGEGRRDGEGGEGRGKERWRGREGRGEGGEGRGGEGKERRVIGQSANVVESEQLSKAVVSPSDIHITTGFENHHYTCTCLYTVGS